MDKVKELFFQIKRRFKRFYPYPVKPFMIVTSLVLLSFFYYYQQIMDRKVHVFHQKTAAQIKGGRIFGNGKVLYERKEKIITHRLAKLEESLKAMESTLSKTHAKLLETQRPVKPPPKKEGLSKDLPRESPKESSKEKKGGKFDPPSKPSPPSFEGTRPLKVYRAKHFRKRRKRRRQGPSVISFPVPSTHKTKRVGVKVPAGSYLKAKLLTGVETGESRPVPVLLQADFFFVGPNRSRIDLSGCFIIAKSKGNLSIERIEMQVTKISCVSRSGKTFERPLNGFAADGANTSFGIPGVVNSKQSRVASMAFLSSIVQGIGQALQQAQTTSQTNASGGSSLSVTGSRAKHLAGSGASHAANLVTNWYLKHAQSLLPTINIGSGQDVWIVLQDTVDLPSWYFKKASRNPAPNSYFYLSRLTE